MIEQKGKSASSSFLDFSRLEVLVALLDESFLMVIRICNIRICDWTQSPVNLFAAQSEDMHYPRMNEDLVPHQSVILTAQISTQSSFQHSRSWSTVTVEIKICLRPYKSGTSDATAYCVVDWAGGKVLKVRPVFGVPSSNLLTAS